MRDVTHVFIMAARPARRGVSQSGQLATCLLLSRWLRLEKEKARVDHILEDDQGRHMNLCDDGDEERDMQLASHVVSCSCLSSFHPE